MSDDVKKRIEDLSARPSIKEKLEKIEEMNDSMDSVSAMKPVNLSKEYLTKNIFYILRGLKSVF